MIYLAFLIFPFSALSAVLPAIRNAWRSVRVTVKCQSNNFYTVAGLPASIEVPASNVSEYPFGYSETLVEDTPSPGKRRLRYFANTPCGVAFSQTQPGKFFHTTESRCVKYFQLSYNSARIYPKFSLNFFPIFINTTSARHYNSPSRLADFMLVQARHLAHCSRE